VPRASHQQWSTNADKSSRESVPIIFHLSGIRAETYSHSIEIVESVTKVLTKSRFGNFNPQVIRILATCSIHSVVQRLVIRQKPVDLFLEPLDVLQPDMLYRPEFSDSA
jgi:hypothetical protein